MPANEVLENYASELYCTTGNIGTVAGILQVDRRTARKSIRMLKQEG